MIRLISVVILTTLATVQCQTTFHCNTSAPCGCSTRPAVMSRIYGGENASDSTWGWAVILVLNSSFVCTGTLISSSWVMASTVCVTSFRPSEIMVLAGSHVFLTPKQLRLASRVVTHPNFNSSNAMNNLALIMVNPPFNMSDPSISQICMPSATAGDFPSVNSSLVALGWGQTVANSDAASILQQATFQRISSTAPACQQMTTDSTAQMCTVGLNGNKTICAGDPGGPLMMFTASQQWVLVGMISYGPGCSSATVPSVHTRIIPYLNWLSSINITGTFTAGSMSPNNGVVATTTSTISVSTVININSTVGSSASSTTARSVSTTSVITTQTANPSNNTRNAAIKLQGVWILALALPVIQVFACLY